MAQSKTVRIVEGVLIGVSVIGITGGFGIMWSMHNTQMETTHSVKTLDHRVEKLEVVTSSVNDIQKDIALIKQSQAFQKEKAQQVNKKLDRVIDMMERKNGE